MNNTELKPCPFCGNEAKILGFKSRRAFSNAKYAEPDEKADAYFVKCSTCGCQTNVEIHKSFCVDKWNRRVSHE